MSFSGSTSEKTASHFLAASSITTCSGVKLSAKSSFTLLVLTVKSMPTCFKMSERLGEPDAKIISTINYLLINLNIIDAITIPIIPAIVKLICKAN